MKPTVHLICNAHLDPVWQWRWEEGAAEALSTFRTAAEILNETDDLIFNHNEAILYRWVQTYDPALFCEIRRLVAAGRWCISGGWFLQPDVNIPGIESIVRHIAEGRRFFQKHFNVRPIVAYNFDSFGHSSGLPQLLARAGYKMYIHMRPQPNELELPSDLYRWRGVDGSEILGLRIVVGLYHSEYDNIEQKMREGVELALTLKRDVPVFWGIGDHGGGPTREDVKKIAAFRRQEDRVTILHSTPEMLYRALEKDAARAPVVTGELQRCFTGTYTSLARLKRRCHESLSALLQAEALRTASWWLHGQPYPDAELEEAWRDHLFNDFHDILPGSCIQPAEQDALDQYGRALETVRRLRLGAASSFNRGEPRRRYIPLTLLNTNPLMRHVPVDVDCVVDLRPKWTGLWHLRLFDETGRELPCQEEQAESLLPFNGWRRRVSFMASPAGLGCTNYELRLFEGRRVQHGGPAALPYAINPATGLVDRLDAGGGRECLTGPLFRPLIVDDDGDAWGADRWSYRKIVSEFTLESGPVVIESGPIRTITESVFASGSDRVVMHVYAYPDWPVLEFRLRVTWNGFRRRLKVSIPTVFRGDGVLCEIPGGARLRPADGQEYVHGRWLLLEGPVGGKPSALAVVSSGQHGFDFADGELRLSILRSAAYCHEQSFPLGTNPQRKYMDIGVHEIRFALTAGDPDTVRSLLGILPDYLTAPPLVYAHFPAGIPAPDGDPGPAQKELLSLSPATVRMLSCKRSWDGDALVVRLQEYAGLTAETTLKLASPALSVPLSFRPYEIKTLRAEKGGTWREVNLIEEV